LELCIQMCLFFLFSPLLFASLLFTAVCKASSDSHFAFFAFLFLGASLSFFAFLVFLSFFSFFPKNLMNKRVYDLNNI